MIKILIQTYEFVDEYSQFEIEDYFERDFIKIQNGIYELEFENKIQIFGFISNMIFFSRVIKNIYLILSKFEKNKEEEIIFDDEIINLFSKKITLNSSFTNELIKSKIENRLNFNFKNDSTIYLELIENNSNFSYLCIDLIGFDLNQRDYKINYSELKIDSIIINYLFYLLKIDELEEKFSIIDVSSDVGDLILESSFFNPKIPVNLKKRFDTNLKKIFDFIPKIPQLKESKNKYLAVVQDNLNLKNLKENIAYSGQKIKLGQYDFDWLDVKFKEADINFVITQIPLFKNLEEKDKYLDKLLYQAEFIFNDAIGIISREKIDNKYFKKYELEIEKEELIEIKNKKNNEKIIESYYLYVLI